MNELNCASREASQKLVDAGIVVKTEKVWALNAWPLTVDGHVIYKEEWQIIDPPLIPCRKQIPAPSMAEVWRELPDEVDGEGLECLLNIWKNGDLTCCLYMDADDPTNTSLQKPESPIENTNPTDALIDLLIWTKGGKG